VSHPALLSEPSSAFLGWAGVVRLGLVQTALGAVVVLTTSTLNRVMVVELALPALLPGLLVALHYAVQITRPRMGHGSDTGGRRTPWILGGMALLSLGGLLAALATTWMQDRFAAGAALATLAFVFIGLGVSASGTSLLALLAKRVAPNRRGPAATVVWLMMIFGFALTAGVAGKLLDPYTPERLLAVSGSVSVLALLVAALALWRVEPSSPASSNGPAAAQVHGTAASSGARADGFRAALADVWAEPAARRFTFFVFLSMLAYSSQDLILEPFAGLVFGWTPGESTALSGVQHGGVLVGMLVVAACTGWARGWLRSLAFWSVGGCLLSAVALALLAAAGLYGPPWPLRETVALMGAANGLFSIAAIASAWEAWPGRPPATWPVGWSATWAWPMPWFLPSRPCCSWALRSSRGRCLGWHPRRRQRFLALHPVLALWRPVCAQSPRHPHHTVWVRRRRAWPARRAL